MAMPDEPLIRLAGVGMAFGPQPILRDIALGIHKGETLLVIGESGCGKTVLLKLIVGLLKPTAGRIIFEGKPLAERSAEGMVAVRRRIGFLFQGAALFDSLSVYENVAYPLRALHSLSETVIRDKVHDRLKEVGLPETAVRKSPAELSGGMRKRVGLARALALDPEVMLYDEPTTGLDPVMTELVNDLIIQTRERRPVTSIVVTHEMKTVRRTADRVVMLYPLARLGPDEPQIIYNGPPDSLATATDERIGRFVA
jgi:phospholipid/cholesterol/gamma-HCH transport system ATP-binding protein